MAKLYKDVREEWSPSRQDYLDAEVAGDPLRHLGVGMFEGSCSEIISRIKAYNKYGGGDIFFEVNYYGYDGGAEISSYRYRKETDKERDARLKRARKARDKKLADLEKKTERERETYLKLKEKFENGT